MEQLLWQIAVVTAVFVALAGLLAILFLVRSGPVDEKPPLRDKQNAKASVLAVLGSGGHTTELLSLMEKLGDHYQPRYYVMAKSDHMSEEKVDRVENTCGTKYEIFKIPRSREVKQSWITTVISTLYSTLHSFPLVFRLQPEIILCNGPGTCIPICIAGFILKMFYPLKVIYVESICRVETLSLSGRILYNLADSVIVQWPNLQKKYPKTLYMGRII